MELKIIYVIFLLTSFSIWPSNCLKGELSKGLGLSEVDEQFIDLLKEVEPLSVKPIFNGEFEGKWIPVSSGIFGSSINPRLKKVFYKTKTLSSQELKTSKATISKDGRLITQYSQNHLRYIFIITKEGELRVFPQTTKETQISRVKHSSLAKGEDVLMAGEIDLNVNGRVFSVSNKSGHYQPETQRLSWLKKYFKIFTTQDIKVNAYNKY